jgi:hypothetical protein
MSITDTFIGSNKDAVQAAALLTAGNIANTQLLRLAVKAAPLMMKGYLDTTVGKIVVANAAAQTLLHFKAGDPKLEMLAEGMLADAYREAMASFDINGLIEQLLSDPGLKNALNVLEGSK